MYKWAVYLNNKCSKEQPEALSVVWGGRKKTNKSKTFAIMALTSWKRCPSNYPDEGVRHKNICVILQLTHQLSGICQTVSFWEHLIWPKPRLNTELKQLDPERLLYPSTVQAQGLTRSQQSCKTVANHANCLRKAKSSMSISSKQFIWWRKSNNSSNDGDDDSKLWT